MQTIEAQAILSAKDRTGSAIASVIAKMKALNSAAANANRASAATASAAAGAAHRAAGASRASAAANGAVLAASNRLIGPGAVGVGAAIGAGRAYKDYADADLSIRRIGITADATEAEVSGLSKSLRDLAQASGKDFKEVTKGLESLVAGGMDLKKAQQALTPIVKTAQAAGAEVGDMASTTLALNQNMEIAAERTQNAFDILVKGGKMGKFELKDMAQYLPSIGPAAAAVGDKGEEGLMRLVAALQTIRAGTGSAQEAADSLMNIYQKMESEETANKFKKMGVDLRKEMAQARKEGKPLIEFFTELTNKTLKGDASKLPQLFSDMQMARGMRAMTGFTQQYKDYKKELNDVAGVGAVDYNKVLQTPAVALQNLASGWDRLKVSVGEYIESLGKLGGRSGTGQWLSEMGSDLSLAAEGGLRPKAIEDTQKIQNAANIAYLENVERLLSEQKTRSKAEEARLGEVRTRLFERRNLSNVGTELNKPLFTEQERRDFARVLETEGPMQEYGPTDPRAGKRVPTPTSDPRKAPLVMPEVQELNATLKAEPITVPVPIEVTVNAGSDLISLADDVKRALGKLEVRLNSSNNGAGSTGTSSPDASPGYGGL